MTARPGAEGRVETRSLSSRRIVAAIAFPLMSDDVDTDAMVSLMWWLLLMLVLLRRELIGKGAAMKALVNSRT